MRVLLINYEYPPVGGGAANATRELAKALVVLGHEPVVLTAACTGRTEKHRDFGVTLIEVPARRKRPDRASLGEMGSFVIKAGARIRRLVSEKRCDVMWAFFSLPCGPLAWWAWRSTRIPYLVLLRGGDVPGKEPGIQWLHTLLAPLRRTVLRNASAIVANSQGLRMASERVDPFPVQVVPNGVDTAFWKPSGDPQRKSPRRYLFVGRFQEQKNLPWLFQFLAHRQADGEAFELHLVGDGPQRKDLVILAEQLGLSRRIVWHGWLDKEALRDRYQTCDILINPSRYEGMPNVVLEAAACGMECWLSDIPEHRELGAVDGDGLLVLTSFQPLPWGEAVNQLLEFAK